jgi:hypothetical protein
MLRICGAWTLNVCGGGTGSSSAAWACEVQTFNSTIASTNASPIKNHRLTVGDACSFHFISTSFGPDEHRVKEA